MRSVSVVLGPAGSGKTTWLVAELKRRQAELRGRPVLALTRMHGARRRVAARLRSECSSLPAEVRTIDSFACWIANRWRAAEGYTSSIRPVSENADFVQTPFGHEADFGRIAALGRRLLRSPTVGRLVGATYPIVVIDEFQDCQGETLEFVKALSENSSLILAGDEFQLLDSTVSGCPAIDWVEQEKLAGRAEVVVLDAQHRAESDVLIQAARRLRENENFFLPSVPIFMCPKAELVAWKILFYTTYARPSWRGTTAIICPSHDVQLSKVLASLQRQREKRGLPRDSWVVEIGGKYEQSALKERLGLKKACGDYAETWSSNGAIIGETEKNVIARAERLARLCGIGRVPSRLVERQAELHVHAARAFRTSLPTRLVTTVHGAKNLEFDNVFVVWTYRVAPDPQQQRRLLYNAVTRAKKNCVVLILGGWDRANEHCLQLLGPIESSIDPVRGRRAGKVKRGGKKSGS